MVVVYLFFLKLIYCDLLIKISLLYKIIYIQGGAFWGREGLAVTSRFHSFYTIKQNILNSNNSEADDDVGQ